MSGTNARASTISKSISDLAGFTNDGVMHSYCMIVELLDSAATVQKRRNIGITFEVDGNGNIDPSTLMAEEVEFSSDVAKYHRVLLML